MATYLISKGCTYDIENIRYIYNIRWTNEHSILRETEGQNKGDSKNIKIVEK